MDFDEILCMQYYEIFPSFSTELWPLIAVKISTFLNIFRNNEWIFYKILFMKFCVCSIMKFFRVFQQSYGP